MKQDSIFYYIGLVTQLGLAIVISILAGLFTGMFLDRVFNTKLICTVIFLIFGIIGGFIAAYKLVSNQGKRSG